MPIFEWKRAIDADCYYLYDVAGMKMVSTLAPEGIRPKLHIPVDINPEVTDFYVCLFVCLYVFMSVRA